MDSYLSYGRSRVSGKELEGPISHADWGRLQSLAARVRYLSYDNQHPRQVYNSVLELVLRRYEAHAAPLLPNLRAMEWRSSTGTQPQQRLLKSLLLTPLLSMFAFHGTDHGLMMDMALLAGLHPTLRHLWIHADPKEGLPTASLNCFTHLRLGGLTSLQDLEISLAPDSLLEESTASVKPFNGFPTLRRFATATTSTAVFPEELLYMLSSVSSSRLTVLDIGVDYSDDNGSDNPSDCLSEVGALPVLQNIQTLLLHADDMWHNAPISLFVLTGPFCTVETLTDVSFSARHNHITISEEDFHRVETAWPRLRVLRVRTRADTSTYEDTDWPAEPPSLPEVVAFAQKLPDLEVLDIEVADVFDKGLKGIRAMASLGRAPQTSLQQITFARGDRRKEIKLPDVGRLARALHAVFPRLRGNLESYGDWLYAERQSKLFRLLQELDCPEAPAESPRGHTANRDGRKARGRRR
ncbi:hypothetical protein C8T65DRAFT_727658 [Cerioporus squamosus]|nr:hypothetical protein C8T65DRAFT_727658 [Cerioporus squamosus]